MNLFLVTLFIGISVICWFFVKRISSIFLQNELYELSILKWKRNPEIFYSLHKSQRLIETKLLDQDIYFGNPESRIMVIVIADLFCQPCRVIHKYVNDLILKQYPDVCIVLRFAFFNKMHSDEYNILFNMLYSLNTAKTIDEKVESISKGYYEKEGFKVNSKVDLENSIRIQKYIKNTSAWLVANNIRNTPSIFINGQILHHYYNISDIKYIRQNFY